MTRMLRRTVGASAVVAVAVAGIVTLPRTVATASRSAARPAVSATAQAAPPLAGTSHEVVLGALPQGTPPRITRNIQIPFLTPWSPAVYAQMKAAARTAHLAPSPASPPPSAQASPSSLQTPSTTRNFAGLDENGQGAVSGAGTLSPSDGGLACSSAFCLEAINSAVAVYNSSGVKQSGFPKSLRAFDGATCSNGGTPIPFDTDAAFDGSHFIVTSETTGNVDGCSEKSGFYLAISKTNNPVTTSWNVWHFDLSQKGTVFCDFPKVGYNAAAVYFSCDNYGNGGTGGFTNARVLGCKKSTLISGSSISCPGFFVNQFAVQPAKTLDNGNLAPVANTELFVSSNNGGPNGLNLSTFRNATSGTAAFDTVSVATNNYSIPPLADNNQNNGGCSACIDTGDNRIGSDVFYRYGHLYVGFNSSANDGTANVPAIYWADVAIVLDDTGKIQSTSFVNNQGTYDICCGDGAYYPAVMLDPAGNMLIIFDWSGPTIGPDMAIDSRRATFQGGIGGLHDNGLALAGGGTVPGASSSQPSRWGDYNVASFDGTNDWFEAEIGTSSEAWATQIAADHYTSASP